MNLNQQFVHRPQPHEDNKIKNRQNEAELILNKSDKTGFMIILQPENRRRNVWKIMKTVHIWSVRQNQKEEKKILLCR
jgi:hypothetical protein